MNATTSVLSVGDEVVRSSSRRKIVGTVTHVHGTGRVTVKWHRSQGGFTRIGGGNQSSTIKASTLVLAKDFVARPLSAPPADAARTSAWQVSMEWHPSGQRVGEYGINLWWLESEQEARAKFAEVVAANPGRLVRLSRQDTIRWVPEGCRNPRDKTEWVRLESVPGQSAE